MAKNELTVLVNSGEGFCVEVPLNYTPEQLKKEKVSGFIEDVKKKYCEALESEENKQEIQENELDLEKLKKFDLKLLSINWKGRGQDLKGKNYKKSDLDLTTVLYDLLDRSKIDDKMDAKLEKLELEDLTTGFYPIVKMWISSE